MATALDTARQKGAIINRKAVLAQAALESGWWRSSLAAKYNNLFGIKAGTIWKGETVTLMTTEYWNGKYHHVPAKWRVYPSWNECIVDYSNLIARLWWFRDARPHADVPEGDGDSVSWLTKLVDRDTPGELAWATGPNYVAKCVTVMSQIDLLLKAKEADDNDGA
jgi:flagellum-specific peptidoglycan hydrolase FlgJ